MAQNAASEDFYSRFHEQLEASQAWPGNYLFKFIIKTNTDHKERLLSLFEGKEAKLTEKSSRKQNYVSLSIVTHLKQAEEVVQIYRQANQIKGIFVL